MADRVASSLAVGLLAGLLVLLPSCGGPARSDPAGAAGPAAPRGAPPSPDKADGASSEWIKRRPHTSLFLIGNQRGKLKPCGCSEPQMGGLERVATLVELARRRAREQFAAVSVGWTLSETGEAQSEAKANLYRAALELLEFDAHLLGTTDLFVPALAQPYLAPLGAEGALRGLPSPPMNAPLAESGPLACAVDTAPVAELTIGSILVRTGTLINPDQAGHLRGVVREVYPPAGAAGRLEPRPNSFWLLTTDATAATIDALAAAMKRLGPVVILDLSGEIGTDRIDGAPLGDGPFVVTMANLGKEAALLDLDPIPDSEGGGWRLSYHAVELTPELESIPSTLREGVTALFEEYKREVKEAGYLRDFGTYPAPDDVGFVGSIRCARCHPGIYQDWLGTSHAKALRTLRDRGYDWDPECIRCHVVGFLRFGDKRWGRIRGGFVDPKRTPHLGDVGCESCHGPGEAHVESPEDRSLWGPGGVNRRDPGRKGCEVCHDIENSFGFVEHYEEKFLPRVDHRNVPSDRRYVDPGQR